MENLHPHEVAAITPTLTPDFATADGDDPGNKTDGRLYDMRLIKLEDAEESSHRLETTLLLIEYR